MGNFMRLVQNENMKIYSRARTYVMMGLIVAVVLLISIMYLSFVGSDVSMWDVVYLESSILFFMVTIFTVVVAASSVAEEFTSGTIKLLLIRPWSRSKILLSKYISILCFVVVQALLLLISTLLINWLCFGMLASSDIQHSIPVTPGTSPLTYILQYYALTLLSSVMTVTLAFMISTIFRSNGLAIGLALFLQLIVNNFMMLLALVKYKWVDYVLFMHLNLTQYLSGGPMREGMTLGFSLSVLGVYYVVFMALTWYVFNKRDVAS